MAKSKPPSIHSRAVRRAASPSLDLDKSLKALPRVEETEKHPATLAAKHNAGVSKKKGTGKNLSRAQRQRQEKAMERAAAVMERTETKVKKSHGRARNVQGRRATWEQLNGVYSEEKGRAESEDEDEDDNEKDGDVKMDTETKPAKKSSKPAPIIEALLPAVDPVQGDDDVDIR